MSQFRTVLRDQVGEAAAAVLAAARVGHDDEAHLYAARVGELLDIAARHGIDTGDWVDATVRDLAIPGC